jgi:hypothetical protein
VSEEDRQRALDSLEKLRQSFEGAEGDYRYACILAVLGVMSRWLGEEAGRSYMDQILFTRQQASREMIEALMMALLEEPWCDSTGHGTERY